MKSNIQLEGIRQLYSEALENNNTKMAKLYKEKLDRLNEEETAEKIHQSIVENFKKKKVRSVAIGGERFSSLNEYQKYYENN